MTWAALSLADVVISTGGIGPTADDLTTETVAEGVRELDSDDAVWILEDLPKEEQAEILDQLPLSALVREALEGGTSRPARIVDTVRHQNRGELSSLAGTGFSAQAVFVGPSMSKPAMPIKCAGRLVASRLAPSPTIWGLLISTPNRFARAESP